MNFLITNDSNYKNDYNLNEISHKNFKILFDNNWHGETNSISKGTSNNFCTINIFTERIYFRIKYVLVVLSSNVTIKVFPKLKSLTT